MLQKGESYDCCLYGSPTNPKKLGEEIKICLLYTSKAMHIKPGKGGAFMQVEMKAVEEGTKTNERFRTEDTVEKLMVEEKDCQFLFEDGTGLTFMDSETFDQFSMPADILGAVSYTHLDVYKRQLQHGRKDYRSLHR